MEDREKFIAEFNKIVQETAKDYPPEDREVKALHSLFDEIILSWDIDVRDHGIGKQIKYFEKNAKKTDKALNKQKEIIHEWGDIKRDKAGNVLLPDNNPQYVSRVSMAFFLSALLKMDHFIIEYLEGLKSKPEEELLTVPQAAEYLKLQTNTIYVLTSQGRIPYSKKGKRVYFSKKELSEWIKSGRRKTHEELAAEAVAYVSNKPINKIGVK